jgi:hypothetical protein
MVEDSIDINFLYLIISVIILITVYNILCNTQEHLHTKKITLETKKNIYSMSSDVCDLYLTNIKKNMQLLYKNFDKSKCPKLKIYIDETHNDLQKFLDGTEIKADDMDLLRYNIINKSDLLKSSDFESEKSFVNILLDIEIILYMMRNSMCDNKKLTLISLHNLMKLLYVNSCSDTLSYSDTLTYSDLYNSYETFAGDREEIYDISGIDILKSVSIPNRGPSSNSAASQNIIYDMAGEEYVNEKETPVYKIEQPLQKNKIDKTQLVSQNFDCSSDYILSYKGSQPYVPFCDINKLRTERSKLKALTTDLNFNRSLRNDYDFLDA